MSASLSPPTEPAQSRIIKYAKPGGRADDGPAASTPTVDSGDSEPPAFPTHSLPASLRDIVTETARLHQLPDDLPGALALGAASAALGQGILLLNPPHETAGNIFLLLSAPSGTGKSNAFRFITKPLYDAEEKLIREFNEKSRPGLEAEKIMLEAQLAAEKRSMSNSHDKLSACDRDTALNRLRDLKGRIDAVEARLQPARIVIEDATAQKMALIMGQSAETIALLSSDAGDVISNILGRWNSTERTDDSLFLKAFSRDPYTQDRIGRGPVALARPCAAVLLIVTPDTLKDLFSVERLSSGGLLPRFLVLPSVARPARSNGVRVHNDVIVAEWTKCIGVLLTSFRFRIGPVAVVYMAPEAASAFDDYRNSDFVDRFDECEDIVSFVARYAEQATRLALVLHAVTYGDEAAGHPLSKETAEAGIQLARWFAGRQLAFMARRRAEKRLEMAEELHDLVKVNPMTLRDLSRRHTRDPRLVKALATEHPRLLVVETVKSPDGGRPSDVLRAVAKS